MEDQKVAIWRQIWNVKERIDYSKEPSENGLLPSRYPRSICLTDYIPRFFETGLLFSLIPSLLPAAGISNSNASMRISRGRRSQAGLMKVIVNGYTKTVSRLFIILQTVSRKRAKLCNTNIAVDLRVANGPRINFVPCMVRLDARPRNYTEIPCSRMCGAFFLCCPLL